MGGRGAAWSGRCGVCDGTGPGMLHHHVVHFMFCACWLAVTLGHIKKCAEICCKVQTSANLFIFAF